MVTSITLVTGGNWGIGLEVSRQLAQAGMQVYIGSRDLHKGEQVTQALELTALFVFFGIA